MTHLLRFVWRLTVEAVKNVGVCIALLATVVGALVTFWLIGLGVGLALTSWLGVAIVGPGSPAILGMLVILTVTLMGWIFGPGLWSLYKWVRGVWRETGVDRVEMDE